MKAAQGSAYGKNPNFDKANISMFNIRYVNY
jgi:hypothetical protein